MSSVQGEPLCNQGDGVQTWGKADLEPEYFDCSAHEENAEDPGTSRSLANTPKSEQGGFLQTPQEVTRDTEVQSPSQRVRDYDWGVGVGRVIGDHGRSSGGQVKTVFEDESSNGDLHIYPEFDAKNVPKSQVSVDRNNPIISDASNAGETPPEVRQHTTQYVKSLYKPGEASSETPPEVRQHTTQYVQSLYKPAEASRKMSEPSNAPPNEVNGANQSERVMAEGPELHHVAIQDREHPEEFTEVAPWTEIPAPEENAGAVDTVEAAGTAVAGGEKEGLAAALNQGEIVSRNEVEHETGVGESVELEPEAEVEGSAPHAGQPEPETTEILQSKMTAPSVDGSDEGTKKQGSMNEGHRKNEAVSVDDFLTQGYTVQAEPRPNEDAGTEDQVRGSSLTDTEAKDEISNKHKDSGLRMPRTRGEINLTLRKDIVASGSDEAGGREVLDGQEMETAASSSPASEVKTINENMLLEPPQNTISQVLALSSPYVGGQRKGLEDVNKEVSESEVTVPKPSTALEAEAKENEKEKDESPKEDTADPFEQAAGDDSTDQATRDAPALIYDPTVKIEAEQPQGEEADEPEDADEAARGLAARAPSAPANDDLPAPRGSEFLDGVAAYGSGSSEMDARLRQIQAEVVEASAASAEEEKRRSFQRIFAEYACLSPPQSTPSGFNAALAAPTASNERNMTWEKSREPGQRSIVEQAATSFNYGESAGRYDSSTADTTSDSMRSRMAGSNTGTSPHRNKSINTATQTPAETATQTEDRSFLDEMAEWAGVCVKRDGSKAERGDTVLRMEERRGTKADVSARSSEPTSSWNSPQLNEVRRTDGVSKRQSPKTQFYTL